MSPPTHCPRRPHDAMMSRRLLRRASPDSASPKTCASAACTAGGYCAALKRRFTSALFLANAMQAGASCGSCSRAATSTARPKRSSSIRRTTATSRAVTAWPTSHWCANSTAAKSESGAASVSSTSSPVYMSDRSNLTTTASNSTSTRAVDPSLKAGESMARNTFDAPRSTVACARSSVGWPPPPPLQAMVTSAPSDVLRMRSQVSTTPSATATRGTPPPACPEGLYEAKILAASRRNRSSRFQSPSTLVSASRHEATTP
mmetsp:Transcript_9087/g.25396  ORF Transcript_9087/g.25396 Transcript_9087/m.25396 type:complete len:260 (-) Transcript_9087:536-1315(-)